jgi:hypothetical protein
MIVEVGSYKQPEKVGFKGWVKVEKNIMFQSTTGEVVVVKR